jgi:hypothetical protein
MLRGARSIQEPTPIERRVRCLRRRGFRRHARQRGANGRCSRPGRRCRFRGLRRCGRARRLRW